MDARGLLAKLRIGTALTPDEAAWIGRAMAGDEIGEEQAGAFAMGLCLRGLSEAARVALTMAMRDSGDVLRWDLPGPVVDKHSTGGLGDCVSLLLAPMLAAAGVYNPMISGRGLGHTGGTLDKLEAIPGLVTEVDEATFRRIVAEVGCAIVSATGDFAPADKRLYAIRDVTSTVESIDLITASILSKKLAAGLEALVLDVKTGSGAFMQTAEDSRALARSLVETANGAGCRTQALITDMNQPLAPSVGNAVEVADVMEVLEGGQGDGRLASVTVELVARTLVMAGSEDTLEAARVTGRSTLSSGAAAERFGRMVGLLGAPADFVERWRDHLPKAQVVRDMKAQSGGVLCAIDGRGMGMAVVRMGGGRMRAGGAIDPSVGLSHVARLGDRLDAGDLLCRIHAADEAGADAAEAALREAMTLGEDAVTPPYLIVEEVS